ncbi:hypothetical protein [Corynebacterium xerosis]|nr:hypothetical protein [Corynebacterium xerosis]
MSMGDAIVGGYDATVDDEYQSNLLHKSNTITYHTAFYGYVALGAVLAWVLPDGNSWIPLLVLAPMVGGAVIGTNWLKRNVPRPRALLPSPIEWAILVFLMIVWIAGISYNAPDGGGASTVGWIFGGLVGGVVGGIVGFTVALSFQKRGRAKDIERLDKKFADD